MLTLYFESSQSNKDLNMNILHVVGCIATAFIASAAAIPVGTLCASLGFTGFAALFGAVVVVSIIQ